MKNKPIDYTKEYYRSYDVQRAGRKSRNPILWFLDMIAGRDEPGTKSGERTSSTLLFVHIANILFWSQPLFYDTFGFQPFVLVGVFLVLAFCFDHIYRPLRHKYFKRHNLPGPYGWGTLDKYPNYRYKEPTF